ncbi:universal stress protein [Streptomyces sp. NPDC006879]|uniref:universal stress protein n=1 Tax=Streptomyces sp. NPDC006879 TaxID=3364767 RepID=UPI0036A83FCD
MEGTVGRVELGPLVVGIDGSEPARRAALWAGAEAARRERSLHLLHAGETDGWAAHYLAADSIDRIRSAGDQLLQNTAAAITERYPAVKVSTEFSSGAPAVSLHRAAASSSTIVVGSRGLGGFKVLLLGSVVLEVAGGARTPVIVVRGEVGEEERGVVLAAVRDGADLDCARYAAREAELRRASLRLLHVWSVLQSVGNVVTMLDDVTEIAGEHLQQVTALADRIREEFPGLTVHADAEKSTSVAGTLVEASGHADLLVMGGRHSTGMIGAALGRAAHSCLHHAQCPVQLIAHPAHEAEGVG